MEKQYKGKWQLEKAYNKNQILMPQDSKGLVLIYGGAKEEQKRRKMREENGQTLEELVQKRSSSMSTNKMSLTSKKTSTKDKQNRLFMANALFG